MHWWRQAQLFRHGKLWEGERESTAACREGKRDARGGQGGVGPPSALWYPPLGLTNADHALLGVLLPSVSGTSACRKHGPSRVERRGSGK